MSNIRRFTYSNPKISKILTDANGFLWIAFEQDSFGICHLKKVLADDISVVFFDIELEVSVIKDLKIDNGYIYVLYTDSTNFLTKYSTNNPFSDFTNFARQTVTEEPIAISIYSGNIYLLTPGEESGNNAQILSYDIFGDYNETIDLVISGLKVLNAKSITNNGTDLWIVTNESPANLVRVYNSSGWHFTITEIFFSGISPVDFAKKIIYDSNVSSLFILSEDSNIQLTKVNISIPTIPIFDIHSYIGTSLVSSFAINYLKNAIYVSSASGKIIKIVLNDLSTYSIIDISDSNNLIEIDVFPSQFLTYVSTNDSNGEAYIIDEKTGFLINTDFEILVTNVKVLDTRFNTVEAKEIFTQFFCLGISNQKIKTDFKVLSSQFSLLEPISRTDFHVYINDVELLESDIDLRSITITHTIDNQSVAEFNLARRHDDLNHTLIGDSSQINNQNSVKIYIGEVLEFNGKIGQLDCNYAKSNEGIKVTAFMNQPTEKYNLVTLSLPGLNERRNLYHIIIQNPKIFNPYIDPSLDIVKFPPKKFLGIRIKLGISIEEMIQNNSAFDGATLANKILTGTFKPVQNYTYFWYTGVRKIHINVGTDLTTLGNPLLQNDILENTSLYVGTSLSGLNTNLYQLVSCTWHNQREFTNLELKLGDGTINTDEIYQNITRFPNYQDITASEIFSALQTYGYIDGSGNILTKFKRTQLPTPADFSNVQVSVGTNSVAIPFYIGIGAGISNKVYNLLSDKLGYTFGSAPFKDVSSKNGIYIAGNKYSDEADGLYVKVNDAYNYTDYCKKIAELEYKKLTNINGDILPETSLAINLTFDAYYYYKLSLLTRINIDNTTEQDIYKNANGFPVAIKTISINSSAMEVSLTCDNKKSTIELEAIDGEFPDDQDPQYFYQGYSYQLTPKYDLQSGTRTY